MHVRTRFPCVRDALCVWALASLLLQPDQAAIAHDRPYVVCVDLANNTMRVVQVPSGTSITFGRTLNQEDATIAGDRVYWIQADASGSATSSSTLGYFDLPA